MRCSPSMRMSPTVNSPPAVCAKTAGTAKRAGNAASSFRRIGDGSTEQTREVVVEGEAHQYQEQHQADLLADGLRTLGQRAALGEFRELEDDLPAVEDRNREQIQHEQAHAHYRQERKERERALAQREAGVLRDVDRPAQ